MVPFLLNYIMAFVTWWRLDNNKKFSFIFALLNLYAPYGKFIFNRHIFFILVLLEAVKTVVMLWTNPREGQKMKMRYEKQIGLMEVFLEAVPTCLVMTILMAKTLSKFFLKGMNLSL